MGRVNLTRAGNPRLVDQTNREGLRETPEQQVLLQVIRYAIQDRLAEFMRGVEGQYKGQKIDLSGAKSRVSALEDRAKAAIQRLRRLTDEVVARRQAAAGGGGGSSVAVKRRKPALLPIGSAWLWCRSNAREQAGLALALGRRGERASAPGSRSASKRGLGAEGGPVIASVALPPRSG